MELNLISRSAVEWGLRGARVPLTMTEWVLGGGHDTSSWPAVIMFERFEAGMKDAVGRATNDDTLRAAARLQRAEAAERENAMAHRTRAAEVETEAERRQQRRHEQTAAERDAVATEAAEQDRRVEEAEEEVHQRAAREAEAKRAATRTTAAKRKQAAGKQATRSRAEVLDAEADALRARQAAVTARGEALDLDRAVETRKSARRSR